ncbi:MAG: NADH-quinone oxidoreductase subunit M [Dehalococcoidia bacterium]|nr:NADH-quinone oxidoreductase subunit M [Dehalococcoidia bacterium]
MSIPYLSILLALPVLGAIVLAFVRKDNHDAIRNISAFFTLLAFVISVGLFFAFDSGQASAFRYVEQAPWIPQLGIQYFLGVDGLSMPLVILTTMLSFLSILVSWHINMRVKEYFALILILETGILGVFTSLDLFLFFLFWEVELLPMYLLIGIWGSGRREYSAMKFLIYTVFGSALMLVGILWLYRESGLQTFDMTVLGQAHITSQFSLIIFALIFMAFAIKLPIWPLHTWLPDAHTDAPTAVSVILAGVLLKMGGYAMIRINVSILPEAAVYFAPILAGFAVISILYGACVSLVQKDLKRLVAYSSVSHMGYVLLGIAGGVTGASLMGFTGASLQMFTHGTITGLLFALVGLVYNRTHTREIAQMKGLAHRMPLIAIIFTMAGLASLGLPGMSGFVAEFLVFVGSFSAWPWHTVLGVFAIVITAGYLLWTLQRILFGPPDSRWAHLEDASFVDAVPIVVLIIVIVAVGVYPAILTDMIQGAFPPILERLGTALALVR